MVDRIQDLATFRMPAGFRGKPAWFVQLWWVVQASLFRWSPQFAYRYRAQLLRMFGAKVGRGTVIRPTVQITFPWKVTLGDDVWLGDDVVLYSLGTIAIGDNSVVSQRSYLCGGDHDHERADFQIRAKPIVIGSQCWIATDTFIAPGVTVSSGTVVGARSSVFNDLPANMICMGSPCVALRPRKTEYVDDQEAVARSAITRKNQVVELER